MFSAGNMKHLYRLVIRVFIDQIRIHLGKKSTYSDLVDISTFFIGKCETEGDLPVSFSEVHPGPPPDSEVIYDDVPCENIPSPDAGR